MEYFESQLCCYGTPYEVVRVYTPNGQPYVNSLILNNKTLIPKTGSSWDDDAVQSYEDAMPGYQVLNFSGGWVTTDALHCRTMGITDRHMLYLNHTPLTDPTPGPQGFYIEAEIVAHSGGNFVNGTPTLYWTTDGIWNAVPMAGLGNDLFDATIPPFPNGTEIKYYINAQDSSGRSEYHPYIGEPGAHTFLVYDPILGSDVSTVSERNGGTINFTLNADTANANRGYLLLGSMSGTQPGTPLPGGQATLPLNWDLFTNLVIDLANSSVFLNFLGTLDQDGKATAQANFPPLPAGSIGLVMHFAFALNKPWDFTSNALAITVVE